MSSEYVPVVAHQFDDSEQQNEAATLGIWVFLVTEVLFFGSLFLAYIVYRPQFPEAFASGSHHLDITLGAINTAILLGSSLTMVLAVRAAQTSNRTALVSWLIWTIFLGLAFLGIKGVEYSHKFMEHLIPGAAFQYEAEFVQHVQIFFTLYFAMTGLHAFHMIIGIGILTVLAVMSWRNRFSANYYAPVEVTGLYWHFVDIVWIFLFPLLYLIGRH